jgi:hypothetical protein
LGASFDKDIERRVRPIEGDTMKEFLGLREDILKEVLDRANVHYYYYIS